MRRSRELKWTLGGALILMSTILGLLAISERPPAVAAAPIWNSVAVCDPSFPSRCIAPAADGSIATTGAAAGGPITSPLDGNGNVKTTIFDSLNNPVDYTTPALTQLVDGVTPTQKAAVSAGGAVKTDGSAVTQPVSAASLPLPTGAASAAKQPALGTAGTASADVITVQGITSMTPLSVAITSGGGAAPATTGGLSTSYLSLAATTNSTSVKASAGQIYHVEIFNNSSNFAYIKFYNKASAPTCNSDTVVRKMLVPANSTNGAGVVVDISAGLAFGTGIAYCVTNAFADNDNTAVAASAFIVNIDYK